MRIIREGMAKLRGIPEREPVRMGFHCPRCSCIYEAERAEVQMTAAMAGSFLGNIYTCKCPCCSTRSEAEAYEYE